MPKGYLGRTMATCHPERIMAAKGKCNACYLKEFYKTHPRDRRDESRQRDFNISLKEYEEIREKQRREGNLCGLCRKPLVEKPKPNLDHDHETMRIRDFLHAECNMALGLLKDDPKLCRLAAEYLERHGK